MSKREHTPSSDSRKTKQQLIDELNSLRHLLDKAQHSIGNTETGSSATEQVEPEILLNAVFDMTSDAIIFVDETYHISHFNRGAEDIFGYSAQEIIGQPLNILLPKNYRTQHNTYVHDYTYSKESSRSMNDRLPVKGVTKNGREFPAKVTITRINHNGKTFLTAFLRDITDIKNAEKANKIIQDELAHVSLVGMLAEVSSSLAHELNQPLSAILANSYALQQQINITPVQLKNSNEIITDLINDTRRAGEVITRLRAMLKPSPHSVDSIDINDVISDVVCILNSDMLMKQVTLEKDLAEDIPMVLADRVHLQQVLINLISNAFDAMHDNAPEDRFLVIRSRQTNTSEVLVSVVDSGVGLSEEGCQQIFEPFYTTKEQGMGMGLSISRTLLQSQGDTLWVESNPERGVTFHFNLKLANENIEDEANTQESIDWKHQDKVATVFVVDDDLSVLKSMKRLLISAGYTVEIFTSAKAFLQRREHRGPGCLLVDLYMPEISGLDLQKALNAREYSLPIIFITGAGDTSSGVRAIKEGAVDFLSKPVDGEKLLPIIARCIATCEELRAEYSARQSIKVKLSSLTARENEVLSLVVKGLRNKQIAYELGISEKTVKAHRGQVMRKMDAGSLANLVHLMELISSTPSKAL